MSADQIQIWGVMPDGSSQSNLSDLARAWAELVAPPTGSRDGYPCHVSTTNGESKRETVTTMEAVAEAFDSAVAGQLGTARDGQTVQYDGLPITVTLYGPEQYHLAPAWEVWVDATLLRATDESVAAERRERIESLATEAHEATGAMFTFAHATINPYDPSIHPDRESLLRGNLSPLTWLSVISAPLVERIGRERLLDVPVGDSQERVNGSVVIRLFEDPLNRDVDVIRSLEQYLVDENSKG
jgi:hypothetical protein